jgi:8-hydroxy-5-deazaflavin:NADPH oxidoreductase
VTHVSVIGTGSMGQAIAGLVTRGGNTVELFDRSNAGTPVTGDIVVLAVPHSAVAEIIIERRRELAGKVVVDITNPLDFTTLDRLTVAPDTSATAEIARELPESRVVKAFNTNFSATLTAGTVGSHPTTVLIAGDDVQAKSLVAAIVADAGLPAVDAGSLARVRDLEALGLLQITLAAADRISWSGGFAFVP